VQGREKEKSKKTEKQVEKKQIVKGKENKR